MIRVRRSIGRLTRQIRSASPGIGAWQPAVSRRCVRFKVLSWRLRVADSNLAWLSSHLRILHTRKPQWPLAQSRHG